jgi:hypothetical protein
MVGIAVGGVKMGNLNDCDQSEQDEAHKCHYLQSACL